MRIIIIKYRNVHRDQKSNVRGSGLGWHRSRTGWIKVMRWVKLRVDSITLSGAKLYTNAVNILRGQNQP